MPPHAYAKNPLGPMHGQTWEPCWNVKMQMYLHSDDFKSGTDCNQKSSAYQPHGQLLQYIRNCPSTSRTG